MKSSKKKRSRGPLQQPFGDIDERVVSPALVPQPSIFLVPEESPASPDTMVDCGISLEDLESASIEQLTAYLDEIRGQLSTLRNEDDPIPPNSPKVIPLDPESDENSSKRNSCDESLRKSPEELNKSPIVITISDDDEDEDETLGHLRELALLSRKTKEIESAMTRERETDPTTKGENADEDVDEDELRAQLLRSLLKKSGPEMESKKQDPPVERKTTETKVGLTVPTPAIETLRIKSPTVPKPVSKQKVKNFVIKFDDDDEEDDDFRSKMDSLLSSARKASSSSRVPTQGTAVDKLSKASQQEYLWLKEQIKAREIKAAGVLGQLKHNQEKMVELKNSMDLTKQTLSSLKSRLLDKKEQLNKAQEHANQMAESFKAAQQVLKQKVTETDQIRIYLKDTVNSLKSEQQEFKLIESECATLKIQLEGSPIKRTADLDHLVTSGPSNPKKLKLSQATANTGDAKIPSKSISQAVGSNQETKLPMKENLVITKSPIKRSVTVNSSTADLNPTDRNATKAGQPVHKGADDKENLLHAKVVKKATVTSSKRLLRCKTDVVGFYESLRNLMLASDTEVTVNMEEEGEENNCTHDISNPTVPTKFEKGAEDKIGYESVLTHLHAYRFSKNFLKDKSHSPLDSVSCNDVDPNVIICNTELNQGSCTNPDCQMQHRSKYLLRDPISQMVDLLLYQPRVAGVSNKSVIKRTKEAMEKLRRFVTRLIDDMKSKGIEDPEKVAMELIEKIRIENPNANITTLKRKVRGRFNPRAVLTFGDFQYDFSLNASGDPVMKSTKISNDENRSENEERAPKARFFHVKQSDHSDGKIPDVNNLNPEQIAKLSLDSLCKAPKSFERGSKKSLQILAHGLDLYPKSALLWREYLSLFQTYQAFKV